jgi:hypothetical protein
MPDHKLRIVGLAVETAAGTEFMRLRRGPSRNDDDANVRPAVIHRSGERQAVYHSREVHVREEHLHFGRSRRALVTHRAPPSGSGVEAVTGQRVECPDWRKEASDEPGELLPTRIEDLQRLITVNGLDRSETGVDEQSDSRNAHQRFVFDD